MALGDQLGTAAVTAIKAEIPGLEQFLQGREDQLSEIINRVIAAEQTIVPQLESAETRLIDHGIDKLGDLLNSQRAALIGDIDRRFVALGAVVEALGQAIQKTPLSDSGMLGGKKS